MSARISLSVDWWAVVLAAAVVAAVKLGLLTGVTW